MSFFYMTAVKRSGVRVNPAAK